MKAICTLLSFIVILWNLSGPFAVSILGKEISIPGYMVWVAICYAGLGTFLIHKVGHRLVNLNFVQQRYEADFRFSMMRLRENAESVASTMGNPTKKVFFWNGFASFWKIFGRLSKSKNSWYGLIRGIPRLPSSFLLWWPSRAI